MSGEENPAVIAPADPADRPSRFRWRVVPAFLGALYGIMATFGGLFNTVALVWLLNRGATLSVYSLPGFLSAGSMTVAGLLLTFGSVLLWRGSFRPALYLCGVGAAMLFVVGLFSGPMPI